MALIQPPMWLQQGTYSARHDRLVTRALINNGGAIGTGLSVAQTTPSASMAVTISEGSGYIEDNISTLQGTYTFVNDASVTVSLDPSNATNPRIDRIVARIYDATISGTENLVAFERVTGTPASSPAAPALPASSIELARVTVPAGAVSVTNANISTANRASARIRSALVETIPTGVSTSRPGSPYIGQMIYETDTKAVAVYDGASVWRTIRTGDGVPYATASGRGNRVFSGATSSGSFTFALPAGRFTVPPIILMSSESVGLGIWFAGKADSTTQVTAQGFATGGAAGANGLYSWTAIQMTPTAAAG